MSSATGNEQRQRCACCGEELAFRWTDSHGIGVCITCGLPYQIYHYEDKKRIDKAPECALTPEGQEIARRYYSETKQRVYPGVYDMGILGGRSATYSGATRADMHAFEAWYKANVPQEAA